MNWNSCFSFFVHEDKMASAIQTKGCDSVNNCTLFMCTVSNNSGVSLFLQYSPNPVHLGANVPFALSL